MVQKGYAAQKAARFYLLYVRYLGRQGLTLHGDYKDEERNVNIRSGISFYHGG